MIPLHYSNSVDWNTIPTVQSGRGLIGYRGFSRYQRGSGVGSLLRALFRMAKPLGKRALRTAAKEGMDTVSLLGSDILEGKNVKDSIKSRAKASGRNLVRKAVKATRQPFYPKLQGYTPLKNEDVGGNGNGKRKRSKKKTQKGSGRFGYTKKATKRRSRIVYKKGGRKRKQTPRKDFFENRN